LQTPVERIAPNASCLLTSSGELRLLINGELHTSQLCRSENHIVDVQEQW
jgi:hypothetical protein